MASQIAGKMDNFSDDSDHRVSIRSQMETLIMRIKWLRPADRVLVEAVFNHDMSYRQVAYLCGKNPRSVKNHIATLLTRLNGPYLQIQRNKHRFCSVELKIAYDHYLLGMGYRKIAWQHKIPQHQVRASLQKLRKFIEQPQTPPRKCKNTHHQR